MNKYRRTLYIVAIFIAVHLFLNVWMWGVRQVFPEAMVSNLSKLYKGVGRESNPWLESWQRWDTPQYQAIAERGYSAFDTALFTPPLFPLLVSLASHLLGGNTLLAGVVVSGIACLAGLLALYKLVFFEFKEERLAKRAVFYLAIFPSAFFLYAAYPESLFLLGAIMALLTARENKWIQAGLWGAVVALSRSPGILILVPLCWAAWCAWREGNPKGWKAPVITLAGAAIFPAYVFFGLHQSPITIITAVGRGGKIAFPGWNIVEAVSRIFQGQLVEENLIELAFTLFFIVLTYFIWKKTPRIYGIYSGSLMLLFLVRLGSPQPLVSMGRYGIEIFPAFLVLAAWGKKPAVNRLIVYSSFLGLLFFSAQFALWGWVG
jgi:Gpi18-like mannosyltransferase